MAAFPCLAIFLSILFIGGCFLTFGSGRTLRRDRQKASDHLHHRDNTDYSSGVFIDAVPITSTANGKAFDNTKRHLSEKLRKFSDDLWWLEMEFAQRN
uniref:Uncharacterized protein n=1 Tax=Globodera rostochiensis TaxID=31243 RepID=A0A914IC65_GLORO